jgi:hypothetical protein
LTIFIEENFLLSSVRPNEAVAEEAPPLASNVNEAVKLERVVEKPNDLEAPGPEETGEATLHS